MGNTTGMVRVYESMQVEDLLAAQSFLEMEGIRTHAQNLGLLLDVHFGAALFATPSLEVSVEDADRARELLADHRPAGRAEKRGPARKCSYCGEESPGGFEMCWSCDASLTDDDAPARDA